MTPVNHDYDDILRRALHVAADSIEPADDGLERIHRRMRKPWLARQVPLMLNDCEDLIRLIAIRLEPAVTRARTALASGPLGASAARISSRIPAIAAIGALIAPSRRHDAAHRGQPPRGWARLRPTLAWLRPALAVATAVIVVVAGVYGLAQLRETLVLSLFPSGAPASTTPSPSVSSHRKSSHPASLAPVGVVPTGGGTGSHRPAPKATCSRTTVSKPTPTPTATTKPTPTDTPSSTPSAVPTSSVNPTSTPSVPSSTLPGTIASTTAMAVARTAVTDVTATIRCTRSTPKASTTKRAATS